MGKTVLPGGIAVHTFPPPPPGLDPAKATDRERAFYGYPRCPVEFPDLVERWTRKIAISINLSSSNSSRVNCAEKAS